MSTEAINFGKFMVAHGAKPKKQKHPTIWTDPYSQQLRYVSPLTGKEVNSRSQRQQEMKDNNVREVDPSERPQHTERWNRG